MNILKLINEQYPNASGAILAGSYLNNDYATSLSDIDILIFDSCFSTISPQGLMFHGVRIDITQIPANNLDNMLRNEQFDQRGILLTMIVKGTIIKDNEAGIVSKVQQKAKQLFACGIHNNIETYKALIKGLTKIRKEFLKDSKPYQKIFLINEFFSLVTQVELIKTTNWRMSGRHKADFLYESETSLIDRLITLIKGGIEEEGYDYYRRIGMFIEEYISISSTFESNRVFENKYLIVDLDYENLNIEHFITMLLQSIKQDHILSNHYRYFYVSDATKPRVYKNKISICFERLNLPNDSDWQEIIFSQLTNILHADIGTAYRSSKIPSFELNEINALNKFVKGFENCSIKTSILMEQLISKYEKYEVKRHLIIAILINSFLLEYLKIDQQDYINIFYYLSSRYLLNVSEQKQLNPNTINEFKKNKYKHFHKFYLENEDVLKEACEKGKLIARDSTSISGKLYEDVIEEIKNVLGEKHQLSLELLNECNLTLEVLKPIVKHSYEDQVLYFILIFQHIQPLLLLNSNQIALQLTILSEIYHRKQMDKVT